MTCPPHTVIHLCERCGVDSRFASLVPMCPHKRWKAQCAECGAVP
jgi:hypothetical protein